MWGNPHNIQVNALTPEEKSPRTFNNQKVPGGFDVSQVTDGFLSVHIWEVLWHIP